MTLELVFETHSVTEDNERGIATGWNDGSLTQEGTRLAVELGDRHRAHAPDAVFTSDLGRAAETADIAFGRTGIEILRDDRLRECDYGRLTGVRTTRLDLERARRVDVPFPDGESYRQVAERVRSFLDDVVRTRDGDRIVVIGHSATKWSLDHIVNGDRLDDLVAAPFDWREGWIYRL